MIPELLQTSALAVYLGDRRVGIINRLQGDRHIFSFEQDYVEDPARPTLSLSFKGRSGGLVTAIRPIHPRLPPFFSNLLPEGHLRSYLAQKAGVNAEREFFLLALLGIDAPGAVTVQPLSQTGRVEETPFLAGDIPAHAPQPGVLRFSLAGVQLKFSAIIERSGGLTIPAQGVGGHWIVKLPSTQFPSVPENEYVMLELARVIGIQVPPTRLVPAEEIQGLPCDALRMKGNALAIERFDRAPGGRRVHMEDFAQIFGLFPEAKYTTRSYADIAAVLWAEASEESAYEFVRRLAFSVAIGNADMHLKNWSVLYPDGRTPILSPAYDFVATLPYSPDDSLALTFGGSRSLNEVTRDQVRRFTDTARMPLRPVWQIVAETIERTREAWKTLAETDIVAAAMRDSIGAQIERVAIGT